MRLIGTHQRVVFVVSQFQLIVGYFMQTGFPARADIGCGIQRIEHELIAGTCCGISCSISPLVAVIGVDDVSKLGGYRVAVFG